MSHKQAKRTRLREAQVLKEIKLLDTIIELTQQRDALREVLMGYVAQLGPRPQHDPGCRCWQCRAFSAIDRSSPDER